jgi:asparagine synthase (glutamine-hydrolysing)
MCGIAGILNAAEQPASPAVLQRMTDAIAHRGPDGEGHWIEGPVGIGHRRLSILDLSPAGRQPMVSHDHRFVLTYNGEVYNFRELRAELQAEGCWFHSQSDSEVVLYALAFWGAAAIARFNGMFALAFWDRKERTLLLARDRFGVKPLYYRSGPAGFSFASEQKALMAEPGASWKVDVEGLVEYFTFQNFFTDRTLTSGVRMLPAGHIMTVRPTGDTLTTSVTRYWDYRFCEPEGPVRAEERREELGRLFHQAVNRQLISDVEVGCYLSGGMDSGSITAVAAKSLPYLKTFTCGFDLSSASGIELAFDERVKAEAMSARFRTEHYEMVLKAGDMERAMPRLASHLEEPRVGQSYPNYYAAKLASRFVKVVMSGAGGDELFGGYPWRYYRAANALDFDDYIERYFGFWQRLVDEKQLPALLAPVWDDVRHVDTREIFREVFQSHDNELSRPEDYVNHSLYFEAKTFLHGLLVVEDKLSMAHGLETRVPFLDNDLVDFAMTCPVQLKLNNLADVVRVDENATVGNVSKQFARTRDGKQILRDVMAKHIPQEIAEAIKQGFSAPDASWFKGDSIDYVQRRLLSGSPRLSAFLDQRTVSSLVQEHIDGRSNRRLFIWSLLNFEQWLENVGIG